MVSINSVSSAKNIAYVPTSTIEIKKETKKNNESDNTSKIIGITLSSLAAIGVSLLAIKKGVLGKKAVKSVENVAKNASEEILNGATYSKVKEAATKNFNHSEKKIIKESISKARSDVMAAQKAVQEKMMNNTKIIKNAEGAIKGTSQGMKSATAEQASQKVSFVKQSLDDIANAAKEKAENAVNNPTSKNIKLAKVAKNKELEAQSRYLKVEASANKRIAELEEKAKIKAENIAKTLNNTTPEKLAAGNAKMEQNAASATLKSVKRKAVRDINKPGYQRALNKFNNYSAEQLQKVVNSSKSSKVEVTVAKDLLRNLV